MIKSEVVTFDLNKLKVNPELLKQLKERSNTLNIKLNPSSMNEQTPNGQITIKDEQIVDLNRNLKKRNLSVEDLFSFDNEK
jgi:hypothetical protein